MAMTKSASEPTIHDSDYYVPCDGVGLTGHPKRMTGGAFLKDSGQYSSRLNQIIRQAGKVPGPGKYVAHNEWATKETQGTRKIGETVEGFGNAFSKCGREFKPMNKVPEPGKYERKDIMDGVCNGSQPYLSQNHRVILGKFPKGNRRSFLESAIRASAGTPAPGYDTGFKCAAIVRNKLEPHMMGPDMAMSAKRTKGRGTVEKEIGPNHYTINHAHAEERGLEITFPKCQSLNFIDKAVREKWVDPKSKKELPGPGTYPMPTTEIDYKISRGTKYCQLKGIGRSPASGYM